MELKIGIIGLGTVGKGVLELLQQQQKFLKNALNLDISIISLCAKSESTLQSLDYPGATKTTNPLEICQNPEIQVVLELAGGYHEPRTWVLEALKNKKHVITANKALLAKFGHEVFPLASENNCSVMFEAAVGGSIPIIKTLQESLISNEIEGIACIINGTCNFILSEMTQNGLDFKAGLMKAQELGYAESDPSFDIKGIDSAHKVALLASLCFGKYVDFEEMYIEGIDNVSKFDVKMATELGYQIKLLGIVNPGQRGDISANVYPALVKNTHQLGAVKDVLNAVFIKGSASGPLLLTGAGAGMFPTASSVISDLISLSRIMDNPNQKLYTPGFISEKNKITLIPLHELHHEFYLRFTIKDNPGALAKITSILAINNISIKSLIQHSPTEDSDVPVVILTHSAKNQSVLNALETIDKLNIISEKTKIIRFYA